jgi:hypothetical protein
VSHRLPYKTLVYDNVDDLYVHLEAYHGISRYLASERLHRIKKLCGYAANDNLLLHASGSLYDL